MASSNRKIITDSGERLLETSSSSCSKTVQSLDPESILDEIHQKTRTQRNLLGDENDSKQEPLLDATTIDIPRFKGLYDHTNLMPELKKANNILRKKRCREYVCPSISLTVMVLSMAAMTALFVENIALINPGVNLADAQFDEAATRYQNTSASLNSTQTCEDLFDLTTFATDQHGNMFLKNNPCSTSQFIHILTEVCLALAQTLCTTYNDKNKEGGQLSLFILGLLAAFATFAAGFCCLKKYRQNYYAKPMGTLESKREGEEEIIGNMAVTYNVPITTPHATLNLFNKRIHEVENLQKSRLLFLAGIDEDKAGELPKEDQPDIYKHFAASPLFDKNLIATIFSYDDIQQVRKEDNKSSSVSLTKP